MCLINLFPSFHDYLGAGGVWTTRMQFNMYLNNKFCNTYIVNKIKLEEILKGIESEEEGKIRMESKALQAIQKIYKLLNS